MHVVRNRIGGEQRDAADGQTSERRNPADLREIVARAPESTAADVADAVDAARRALPQWAATGPSERARLLEKAAAWLDERAEEIAREMVAEEGKPLADALNEAHRTPVNLRLYAGEALRLGGETFPSDDRDAAVYTVRDPVGIVGVITPWNFPLNLASRKIGPALAAGNTVVFKPASPTPRMGDRLGEAFHEAGFPPGVVNVVHGHAAGANLVADTRVAAISFTGSTAVGRKIFDAMSLGRRCLLELGGNNPVVVLDDADLDRAAEVVARSSFSLTGQACTAAGRILAHEAIHDELLERVVARAEALVVGNGMAEGVTIGPLVSEQAVDDMEKAVREAVDSGARVVTGGQRLRGDRYDHGCFFPPTVLAGVDPAMSLACNEVFGPVVGFERIGGIDEGIERGNATEYGLTASICTSSLHHAQQFATQIQAGMVKVNRPTVGAAVNAPFGGIKQSGTGVHKEQLGPTVMDFFTQQRTVVFGA